MVITWEVINKRQPTTVICAWGADCQQRQLAAEEACTRVATEFRVYGQPLEIVAPFKYFRHMLNVPYN